MGQFRARVAADGACGYLKGRKSCEPTILPSTPMAPRYAGRGPDASAVGTTAIAFGRAPADVMPTLYKSAY